MIRLFSSEDRTMLDFHSETHTATNGAKVEVGTVTFQGRDFSAMGSVVDEANGIILGYVSGAQGIYYLTTWEGKVLGSLKLTGTWKNRNVFGGFPVTMYAWSAVIGGKKYSGRNTGAGMLLRMKAGAS
jgi:hypothetical protein